MTIKQREVAEVMQAVTYKLVEVIKYLLGPLGLVVGANYPTIPAVKASTELATSYASTAPPGLESTSHNGLYVSIPPSKGTVT